MKRLCFGLSTWLLLGMISCGQDETASNPRPDRPVTAAPVFYGDPLDDGPLLQVRSKHSLANPDPARQALSVTLFIPSADGLTPAKGPFPLVIVLPGFSGLHMKYLHFINHFTSHGLAVMGMDFAPDNLFTALLGAHFLLNQDKNVQEIIAALNWVLQESPLADRLEEENIAIAGHSLGGKMAFFAAATDSRFKIVIGWDPQNAGGGPPCFYENPLLAPIMDLVHAMLDTGGCNAFPVAPNSWTKEPGILHQLAAETLVFAAQDVGLMPDKHHWAEHFFEGAPSPAHLVRFQETPHTAWGGPGPVTDITKRGQLALLLVRFKGFQGLDQYLPSGDFLNNETMVDKHLSK